MEYAGRNRPSEYYSALGEVPSGTQDVFDRMSYEAGVTWSWMTDSWKRLRRPNEKIDIGALQGALGLERSCTEALDNPTTFLHPNTNQLRYDLYAGALLVQRALPISVENRAALWNTVKQWHRGYERWLVEPPKEHEPLIAHWRQWLRSDGMQRAPVGSELHGEASLLAAASYRMMTALNPIRKGYNELSDTIEDTELAEFLRDKNIDALVLPVEREPWRRET
jgi:hypothetical protein